MSDLPTTRLSEDLRFLVQQYPREGWDAHANLGSLARFWLSRHDMFRQLGGEIASGTLAFREARRESGEFVSWMAPRLQFFLSQLDHHHQIEDHHYFPVFRSAEERLAKGFDLLDGDHDHLHHILGETAAVTNRMFEALRSGGEATSAIHAYADQVDLLNTTMLSHLRDEEDLIIPLILDRSEEKLGVA